MDLRHRVGLHGTPLAFHDARAAIDARAPGGYATLPLALRVLAENLLRRCPEEQLAPSLTELLERRRDRDFPWFPARVILQDILGATALVDLAGLRDAIAERGGDPTRINPVVPAQLVVDHSLAVEHAGYDPEAFAKNRAIEERRNADRFHFIDWARRAFANVEVVPQGNGILHQINVEKLSPVVHAADGLAYPDTLIGTDSHTPMVCALGVIGIGVGGLEAESVLLGRAVWLRTPELVKVALTGRLDPGITATDLVLALTAFLRRERVVGAWIEFGGDGLSGLSLGDRATIANMTPEFGATAALFPIDGRTLEYLRLTGRSPEQVRLVEAYAAALGLRPEDLAAARHDRTLGFDLAEVTRQIAGPANPHQRIETRTLTDIGLAGKAAPATAGELPDGAVILSAITSCTNTSNPRNMIAAGLLARNAVRRGLARKAWVKTSLAPGSKVVELYLREAGLLADLERLGFGVVGFACTSCNGMSGALDPAIENEILARKLYTVAVLSGNRNFEGRIHPRAREAYLASPPLCVAYALAGSIRVDVERDPLGLDAEGQPVYLRELWPDDGEVDALVAAHVRPEQFDAVYRPMFARSAKTGTPTEPRYRWRPQSTYIRRPPYWDEDFLLPRSLAGMRPLAILGDNVTTDHLSPSNAILPDSAAGEYLLAMGLEAEDFNSYATHRGDHLTAMRATLANPRLKNEMVRDADGRIREGSLARLEPEGTVVRMWEAIETYRARRQPLIVIAGVDYGQGSSRDWAAKGVRLAGVEAVVAESFERIHRTNLVGMGVLPLCFLPGSNRLILGLDGSERYAVLGAPAPGALLTLRVERRDGRIDEVPVLCRLDTAEELTIYEAGGVLQRFALDFLASSG